MPSSASGSRFTVRPAVRVVVVLALLALIGVRVFVHSSSAAQLSTSELAHLPVQLSSSQPRPAVQSAALSCFEASSTVTSSQSSGKYLMVRFKGAVQLMKIEFLPDENAAIRVTNANPKEYGDFYNNTIWFDAPTNLTIAQSRTIGRCIPDGSHHRQ